MSIKSGGKFKPKQAARAASRKTREKVTQVLTHARDSLKLLETLEKETLARAKKFVSRPLSPSRRNLTNEKILSSLKKIGVASQEEVNRLKTRIERLEAQLSARNSTHQSENQEHTGAIPRV